MQSDHFELISPFPSNQQRFHIANSLCLLFIKDYDAFFEARENNAVYAFLGLTAPPGSKV